MTAVQSISAEARDRAGKGAARAIRRTGRVPAVIYGDKKEPMLISLDPAALGRLTLKKAFFVTLLDVELAGQKHRVLPRDVQVDPVTDRPLHVDFQRIGKDTKVHVHVPVIVFNEAKSPGLKRGGVLNLVRHEIEFICSPDNIPQKVEVDVSGLDIGGSIHIDSVKLPEGATPVIRERDFTIVTIGAPTGIKAEAEEAAEKAAVAAAAPAAGAPGAAPGAVAAAGAPAAGGATPAAGAPAAGAAKGGAAKGGEKKK